MAREGDALAAALRALVEPAVCAAGCDLEDLSARMAGRRRLVTVLVDRDGGIDLDTVAEVSRVVSEVLDTPEADALLHSAYVLEVSSPGVERPLTMPRHWRRNVGRMVKVTMRDGSTIVGRIWETSQSHAVLDDGKQSLAFADVSRAVIQVEFGRKGAGEELDDDIVEALNDDEEI